MKSNQVTLNSFFLTRNLNLVIVLNLKMAGCFHIIQYVYKKYWSNVKLNLDIKAISDHHK